MAGGRPSKYSPELSDKICARLSHGESMRSVAKSDDMPSTVTMFAWMRRHPEFLSQYARAKEESADALVEEMIDIADDATNDYMENMDQEGSAAGYKFMGENVQRSKLRIDARKWVSSKLKPKKYGEKLELAGDRRNPLALSVMTVDEYKKARKDMLDGDDC